MPAATPIHWTTEHVQRFWDYWSRREDAQDSYFAKQFGGAVIAFLEHAVRVRDRNVLDYGAGPGYLVGPLMDRGARVSAVDYSEASVDRLNSRFRNQFNWGGARRFEEHRLPWSDETFDIVCCLETIEHVLEEHTDLIFQELHRVLKAEGLALFTTPHDEDLARSDVYCPQCGSEFHRWQHVRKWTSPELAERLSGHGFETVFCRGVNLQRFQKVPVATWRKVCFADAEHWLKREAYRLLDWLAPRPFPEGRAFRARRAGRHAPHLVAVVRKPRQSIQREIEPRRRRHSSSRAA